MQYYDVKISYYSEESDSLRSGHGAETLRVKASSEEEATEKAKKKFDARFKERNKNSAWPTYYDIKSVEVRPVPTCSWCGQPKEKCICG
jgi:hypothetical protein